jgi:hypothetical protein
MKGRSFTRRRSWIVPVTAVIVIGGHGILLYYFSTHLALSVAVVSVVALLVLIKHLALLTGALDPLYALLRRRPRH